MHYYFSRPKHFHLSHFLALSLALSGRCFVQTKRTHSVLEHCHCLFVTKKHPRADAFLIFQQCSIFPGRRQPSIFDDEKLNFCVRYVYRWILFSIATGNGIISSLMLGITEVVIDYTFFFDICQ